MCPTFKGSPQSSTPIQIILIYNSVLRSRFSAAPKPAPNQTPPDPKDTADFVKLDQVGADVARMWRPEGDNV